MNFWKRNRKLQPAPTAVQVQTAGTRWCESPLESLSFYRETGVQERRLYRTLRDAIPVIDAAIYKLVRLLGEFEVQCEDLSAQQELRCFLENVQVNGCQTGIDAFLSCYFSQLLTYGTAVGEMVLTASGMEIGALYNADLDTLEFRRGDSPLDWRLCRKTEKEIQPISYPELIVTSALNPPHGNAYGVSILHGLPFVSNILMKIYHTIGVNWERVGNVRFAVTYQPTGDSVDRANAREHAQQISAMEQQLDSLGITAHITERTADNTITVTVTDISRLAVQSQPAVQTLAEIYLPAHLYVTYDFSQVNCNPA